MCSVPFPSRHGYSCSEPTEAQIDAVVVCALAQAHGSLGLFVSGNAGTGGGQWAGNIFVDRIVSDSDTCLPRALATDENGQVACQIVEVTEVGDSPACTSPGRAVMEDDVAEAVLAKMSTLEICGDVAACSEFSLCRLTPAGTGIGDPDYDECLHAVEAAIMSATGYCYIDALRVDPVTGEPAPLGNPDLVAECQESERRMLRFVTPVGGQADVQLPWPNSTLWAACTGTP